MNTTITKLKITFTNKHLLKKLNLYPKLLELQCYNNGIKKLNLKPCFNLTLLNCSTNFLETLDLSFCAKLQRLYCQNNSIKNLDLSHCTNLKRLDCSNNRIINLILPPLVKLQELNCESNFITNLNLNSCINLQNLDFSNCKELKDLNLSFCINLKTLRCGNSNIKTLDLSHNNQLENLYCSNNKIKTLNLSYHPNLKIFSCSENKFETLDLSSNVNLKELNCSENRLTSLDLSSNVNLKELNCSENRLTILDLISNVNLKELNCFENLLKILKLSFNADIKDLDCSRNQLTKFPLTLFQLRNISDITFHNNPFIFTRGQLHILQLSYTITNTISIVNDNQNIHDVNISKSMFESFNNILCNKNYTKCKNVIVRIVEDDNLDTNVKNMLIEYASDKSVHSLLNVNFEQALSYIYPLHNKDSLKILKNEMLDSECQFFTGRLFRLINSLNGIIPEVNIKISLNQDLNNMASNISEMDIDNPGEVFLKNVFDKYPDIKESYLEPWLKAFNSI